MLNAYLIRRYYLNLKEFKRIAGMNGTEAKYLIQRKFFASRCNIDRLKL